MQALPRSLLRLALLLAAIVVAASAALRLSANGIGCTPWPACYGQASTAAAANAQPAVRWLRVAHRITASTFALVAAGAVALGWRRWRRASRVAAVALLGVTAVLAWVGRFTPSPLPAVTLVNVLGGFALLALLAFLLASDARQPPDAGTRIAAPAWLPVAGLLALGVQAAGGALISARLAGNACVFGCSAVWLPGAAVLADPFVAGTAADLLPRGGESLQLLHRLGGGALSLLCLVGAGMMVERRTAWAGAAMLAAAATGALGFVVASAVPALPVVVLHALAASALGAALAAMLTARQGAPAIREVHR